MKILVVDDHPMIAEAYINSIEKAFAPKVISFSTAHNCEEAYGYASNTAMGDFNYALIDYRLPAFKEKNLLSGCDVAILIKKVMPRCKVIVVTAHTEVLTIYDIYKRASPHGLVIKNDITLANLPGMINRTETEEHFLSPTAKNCITEIWKKDLMVEDCNRQILFHLSRGYKVKELGGVIHLAQSTIQKRVINMKRAFGVHDDNSLIKEAIRQGYI